MVHYFRTIDGGGEVRNWDRLRFYLRALVNAFHIKPGNENILNSSATNSGLEII